MAVSNHAYRHPSRRQVTYTWVYALVIIACTAAVYALDRHIENNRELTPITAIDYN